MSELMVKRGDRNEDVRMLQQHLNAIGQDTNGIDGIFGGGTSKALELFTDTDAATSQDFVVISTCALMEHVGEFGQELPLWLIKALNDYGIREISGKQHNERVLKIWKDAKLGGIKDDETPWCSGAVSAWIERSHIKSGRTAWARNYLNYGSELDRPLLGAIVVFERGSGGHVGFVTGITEDKKQIRVIGGNQANTVNERMFDVDRVLGYRTPDSKVSLVPPPIVDSGLASKNEA